MKTGRISLIICIIVSMLISVSSQVFALPVTVTQQDKVQLLDELRIFTGSNGDYRLNDQLSRSEAAALAVRIMGKDFEVLLNASKYKTTPYPDVDSSHWYAPYVGFCTKEGILSGDTSGNYKPDDFTTEKSFLKIVLGVLGYELNVDYMWSNVYRKAFEEGLVTDLSYIVKEDDNTNFKRSDAVNIIYNALTLKEKNTDKELFYKLIDSNVITTEDAIELGLIEQEEAIIEEEDETPTEINELVIFDDKTISIVFNEDIKTIESIKIYEVNDDDEELDFEIEEMEEDYIILKLDRYTSEQEYTIELCEIEDMEENIIEVLYTAFVGPKPKIVESNFFRIQKIEAVNQKSVKVYFTHPVNSNSENSLYYSIWEDNRIFAEGEKDQLLARLVNSEDNCVLLSLKNSSFEEGNLYTVEIDGNITSSYGVNLNDGSRDEMSFTAISGEVDGFRLDEIIPYDRKTILLSFNKEVNPFLAQQVYNFYITDEDDNPIKIEKVTIESQGLRAGEVVFINIEESFSKNKDYFVTINNLNDVTRQEYITEMTYSFEADYGRNDDFEIEEVDAIDERTVEVYFSTMPEPDSATNESYYTVTPRKGNDKLYPERALYDQTIHPYKVMLYFKKGELKGKKEYELKINYKFKDYMGNESGGTLKDRFNGSSEEKASPVIEEAIPVSSDAVKLVFDKELAFNQNNLSPANYCLEYNYSGMGIKKFPLSVLYVNTRTLVLKFEKLTEDITYTLKFSSIVDYSGVSYKVTGEGKNYVEFMFEEE